MGILVLTSFTLATVFLVAFLLLRFWSKQKYGITINNNTYREDIKKLPPKARKYAATICFWQKKLTYTAIIFFLIWAIGGQLSEAHLSDNP